MDLFISHGYEKTTMRMIAGRANVNVALSYYYFPSKEHLVFEFYRNFTHDFIERSAAVVESNSKLEERPIGVAETMFAVAGPYHASAGSLFARVIDCCTPMMYCWMHDHSEHQQKTRTILRQSVRLVVGLLRLSTSPGARHFWRQMLSITHLVRSNLLASREGAAPDHGVTGG